MTPRPEFDEALSPAPSGDVFLPPAAISASKLAMPSPGAEAKKQVEKSAAMLRATSMLEMSDIRDMMRFGEGMKAVNGERAAVPAAAPGQDDDDGGFFIDTNSSDDDAAGGGFLQTPSVPQEEDDGPNIDGAYDIDGTYHVPASSGGMRRVMSMASLPSSRVQRLGLCPSIAIHTISEEEVAILEGANRAPAAETGLDSSINGRRPFLRTISSSSFGRLRRSSSRGSANNLLSVLKSSNGSVTPEDARTYQRAPEVGLDASISSRDPRIQSRTSETGLDESINRRKPRRSRSSTNRDPRINSRTSETGLDESINRRKPRRSTSSASIHKRAKDPGLDASISNRDARIQSRALETGLDESITWRSSASMRRSSSSASVSGMRRMTSRSSLKGSANNLLDESVTLRRPSSSSMKRTSSSASMRRLPSRSSLRGSSNNLLLRSSLKSAASNSSAPSMDDTNHSLDSNEDIGISSSSATMRRLPSRSSLKGSSNNLLLSHSLNSANSKSSSIDSGEERSNSMKRNVSFSSLEIRSYNVTLGDAPTTNGPPVSLSWEHSATEEHDVDHYETSRADNRRNKQQMIMPPSHRQYLLMRDAGFSRGEIKSAMNEVQRCAKQRERTAKGLKLGLQPVEEALEKTKRKLSFKKKQG